MNTKVIARLEALVKALAKKGIKVTHVDTTFRRTPVKTFEAMLKILDRQGVAHVFLSNGQHFLCRVHQHTLRNGVAFARGRGRDGFSSYCIKLV